MPAATRDFTAQIIRVIDGDTVEVSLDVGFGLTLRDHVRVLGINCPEMSTPDGPRARARTAELLPIGSYVVAKCASHRDKYGRVLADFVVGNATLGEILLAEGLAVPLPYGGPQWMS